MNGVGRVESRPQEVNEPVMRHCKHHRKLGRTSEHRLSLRRSLAQSLFEHGQITTTLPKAKDVRPFVERLITLARKASAGSLAARQHLTRLMCDRGLIPAEHRAAYDLMADAARRKTMRSRSGRRHRTGQARAGMDFTAESVVHRLINTVAPQFNDRPGGYTRIIKLARRRIGDNGEQAVLQLVGREEEPGPVSKPKKTARGRRIERRYAAAARASRDAGKGRPSRPDSEPADEAAPETETPAENADATAEEQNE